MSFEESKDPLLRRALTLDFSHERAKETDSNTVTFSFSSEAPVMIGVDTKEVLVHEDGAIDFSRLLASAPFLVNHDRDQHLGVVEKAWLDAEEKRGYCTIRFSERQIAQELKRDMLDGISPNISVGYQWLEIERVEAADQKDVTIRVKRWSPYEISSVSIPADISVGLNRSARTLLNPPPDEALPSVPPVSPVTPPPDHKGNRHMMTQDAPAPVAPVAPAPAVFSSEEAVKAERQRVLDLTQAGQHFGIDEKTTRSFIDEGKPFEAFARYAMQNKPEPTPIDQSRQFDLDLTPKERGQFSLSRLIVAQRDNNWSNAGFEREISQEAVRQFGDAQNGGIMIPMSLLQQERALDITGAGTPGAALVRPQYSDYLEVLRNAFVLNDLGITFKTGWVGDYVYEREGNVTTAAWLSETATITKSDKSYTKATLSPKTIAGATSRSYRMLKQTNRDIDAELKQDLALAIGYRMLNTAFFGTGVGDIPTGILATAGIGSVAMGTNGGNITRDAVVSLMGKLNDANIPTASRAFVTNSQLQTDLRRLKLDAGSGRFLLENDANNLLGERLVLTNEISRTLVKGTSSNCSALFFGNFAALHVVLWGGVELVVDPYTQKLAQQVEIVAHQQANMTVVRPSAFAVIADATPIP